MKTNTFCDNNVQKCPQCGDRSVVAHVSKTNEIRYGCVSEGCTHDTGTGVYETKFGKFAACDKATWKKLKRINHLFHQVIRPWAYRWERAQRRLPHNRFFRIHKVRIECKESWLFSEFYKAQLQTTREWIGGDYQNVSRMILEETQLLRDFRDDYFNARHPKDKAEAVAPLKLTVEQIDALLARAKEFANEAR